MLIRTQESLYISYSQSFSYRDEDTLNGAKRWLKEFINQVGNCESKIEKNSRRTRRLLDLEPIPANQEIADYASFNKTCLKPLKLNKKLLYQIIPVF